MRVLCPGCGQEVDTEDPATVQTFERVATPTFGEASDQQDGMRAAFHPGCYDPADPRYRRAD